MMVDLIVENGRIHTGDPEAPVVDAVAVLNGRIVAAGNDVEGLRARERVDVHDRVVLPGFNDAHAHSVWFGMTLIETDLSGVRSLDDLYRIIGDRARDGGADEWIVASGFNPVLLRGAVPDPDVLDRVSGGRPVWIKHASGHSCQLNGEGLRRTAALAHLDQEIDGGRIVLDQTGRPTGVLEERAMSFVRDVLLPYPLEVIERALDLATAQYAREGLTSVTDAGVAGGWIGHAPGELAAYQNAREHAVLRTRMQVMPVIDALAGLGVHSGEPARLGLGAGVRTGWGDEWLQLGPVKVFTDGSVLGRTAQLSEPYEGCPGYHGYLQEDQESLRRRVLDAYAAGWSLALHAVGDAALDLALDMIEEGITRHGTRPVPNRVEHGAVVRPEPGRPARRTRCGLRRTAELHPHVRRGNAASHRRRPQRLVTPRTQPSGRRPAGRVQLRPARRSRRSPRRDPGVHRAHHRRRTSVRTGRAPHGRAGGPGRHRRLQPSNRPART